MKRRGFAMKYMKYKKITFRLVSILFCISLCFPVFSCVAFADTGPKPSVRVKLENLHGACYGTLLSEEKSNGPNSAYDPESKYDNKYVGNLDEKTWEAFVNYEDKDGFYFLQVAWNVTETKEISWTYYPPSPFKILLYFPETNTFVSSGIYEKYAFDSYFTVDLNDFDTSDDKGIFAERSYEYKNEILSLVVRIIFTVIIEILLALLFGLRKKKELLFIALSGLATGASWLCYYYAIQNGTVSVVVPIDKLSILVTIIFSYFVFKERLSKKAFAGLGLMVAGTLLMAVFQ
jgi:uncharacterized membrane protein